MNDNDQNTRFTIRSESSMTDPFYLSEAENLRIEKLSTRVTLVAVIIPCLLVIVLAVAYLDIKNRVVNTQSTGSIGVQNLSKDLESRFSSLSLKQARLEEQLAANTKAVETATAALQVNLKKSVTEIRGAADDKADRSDLAALAKKLETPLAGLQKEMNQLNETFEKFDEELAGQIVLLADGLTKDQARLEAIESSIQRLDAIETSIRRLDAEKVNKESMDLALGLERLGLQELIKDRVRELAQKLTALADRIDTLNRRLEVQEKRAAASTPRPSPPDRSPSPPSPASAAPVGSPSIQEQTIN